tara:strand:+ start:914 stop:1111 length:198 start_codon:yes stop_codon:yes gene_type:complete
MSNLDRFYWGGAIILAVSPLFPATVWYGMAITGLGVLTIQAYQNKLWNLVAVNTVSILAYITNLF